METIREGLDIYSLEELQTGKGRKFLQSARNSLIESLVIAQFKFIGDKRSTQDIFEECRTTPYYDNHTMTEEMAEEFKEQAILAIKNVLKVPMVRARKEFSWWWLFGGFSVIYKDKSNGTGSSK